MRMFPLHLMTIDRLDSYDQELKGIRDQFLEFSTKVATFAINYSSAQSAPKAGNGQLMNPEYWHAEEQTLGQRMTEHQGQIRKAAVNLQSSKSMSEFERKEIEIKEEELKLKKRQIELMEENQTKSDKAEKAKANSIAQSKYEEIMLLSTELDDHLDRIPDWSKATRADVMTAMKSMESWGQKFAAMNRIYMVLSASNVVKHVCFTSIIVLTYLLWDTGYMHSQHF